MTHPLTGHISRAREAGRAPAGEVGRFSDFERGRRAGLEEFRAFIDRLRTEAYREQSDAQERYDAASGEAAEVALKWLYGIDEHLRHFIENPDYFGVAS